MTTPRPNHAAQTGSKGVGAKPWIKMRTDLWDDPRVSALCEKLKATEATVIGGLYRLWAIADSHSVNGELPGLTAETLDRKAGIPGFALALADVGWLVVGDVGITIPEFSVHNGQSAKSRAQGTLRQQQCRARSAESNGDAESSNVKHLSRNQRDKSVTRLDETRIEKKKPPPLQTAKAHSSADWQAVEAGLFELGLNAAGGAVELAQQRDYLPARVRDAIAVWQDHEQGHPGDWGPGTIHDHIKHTPPNIPAEQGWWPKPESKSKSSAADAHRQTRYGSRLHGLSKPDLLAVMERAGIPADKVDVCKETPKLFNRLVAQLAHDDVTAT